MEKVGRNGRGWTGVDRKGGKGKREEETKTYVSTPRISLFSLKKEKSSEHDCMKILSGSYSIYLRVYSTPTNTLVISRGAEASGPLGFFGHFTYISVEEKEKGKRGE